MARKNQQSRSRCFGGTTGKGDHPLKPKIKLVENEVTSKHDAQDVQNHLTLWFKGHLSDVIASLVLLEVPQGVEIKDDAVSKIAARIYNGMGIVPREELEDLISELTTETRADLRAKKIRLGPILAFIPELNKPAAVRLRAMLWSIFNGHNLPVKIPADGIVSVKIEDKTPDPNFYRSIGYPLYGGRAVRIDMLDRVVSCVYDHADKGKFQARHEMAEWLGCSIEDLYKVLESMGHIKIYDPAEQEQKEDVAEVEKPDEDTKKTETDKTDKIPAEKPKLATFRLKKGKAFQSGKSGAKKKQFSKDKNKQAQSSKKKPVKNKGEKKKDKGPRVISIEAETSEDDSPFAILKQLKK